MKLFAFLTDFSRFLARLRGLAMKATDHLTEATSATVAGILSLFQSGGSRMPIPAAVDVAAAVEAADAEAQAAKAERRRVREEKWRRQLELENQAAAEALAAQAQPARKSPRPLPKACSQSSPSTRMP